MGTTGRVRSARGVVAICGVAAGLVATTLVATTLVAACGTTTRPPGTTPAVTAAVPSASTPIAATTAATAPIRSVAASPSVPSQSAASRDRGGRGGGRAATGAGILPVDWPRDLPIPRGQIIAATGSNGRWSVQIVAAGPAAAVLKSAVGVYSAAGFTPASDSVLNEGNRQITLVVENRDHSNSETNLVIAVSTP